MISKFTCSVYEKRERFSPDGCKSSYQANLPFDPYPLGTVTGGGIVLRWPVFKCKDNKWRAQGFEGCGYYIQDRTVQSLVKKRVIYIDNNQLYDYVSKEAAFIPKSHWRGECKRCGRCCMSENGTRRCKYLKEGVQ